MEDEVLIDLANIDEWEEVVELEWEFLDYDNVDTSFVPGKRVDDRSKPGDLIRDRGSKDFQLLKSSPKNNIIHVSHKQRTNLYGEEHGYYTDEAEYYISME